MVKSLTSPLLHRLRLGSNAGQYKYSSLFFYIRPLFVAVEFVKLHLNNQHQYFQQQQVVWFVGRSCRAAAAALPVRRTLSPPPPAFFLEPSQTNPLSVLVSFSTVPQMMGVLQNDSTSQLLPTVPSKWRSQSHSSLWVSDVTYSHHAILKLCRQWLPVSSLCGFWTVLWAAPLFETSFGLFHLVLFGFHYTLAPWWKNLAQHNVMQFLGVIFHVTSASN